MDKYWVKDWKNYGSVDGTFYAAPLSANLKSLVWYSPGAFKKAGYTVPTTWADMMTLSAKIATDTKGKVWCGGIGSGTATGWPATDWLEEVVLRQFGGQVYDDWVSHKVKFSDPPIQAAMKTIADWYQNPAWVNAGFGDVKTIATTTFQDAGKPILTGNCWMLQQASFYGAQLPKGTKVGPDGDVFAFFLPAMSDKFGVPVEGGGEFATAFRDAPEVKEVQTYLSTPLWATNRIKAAPGWASANQGVDPTRVHRPGRPDLGEVPDRPEGDVPVRRFRPHAGRGRLGPGVEVADRLVRAGSVDRAGGKGHRRRLADRLSKVRPHDMKTSRPGASNVRAATVLAVGR